MTSDDQPDSLLCRPLSPSNELQVLRSLRELCGHFERLYPTSLDDDVAALAKQPSDMDTAVLLTLIGEKEVLRWYQSLYDQTLTLIDGCQTDLNEFNSRLRLRELSGNTYCLYWRKVHYTHFYELSLVDHSFSMFFLGLEQIDRV